MISIQPPFRCITGIGTNNEGLALTRKAGKPWQDGCQNHTGIDDDVGVVSDSESVATVTVTMKENQTCSNNESRKAFTVILSQRLISSLHARRPIQHCTLGTRLTFQSQIQIKSSLLFSPRTHLRPHNLSARFILLSCLLSFRLKVSLYPHTSFVRMRRKQH